VLGVERRVLFAMLLEGSSWCRVDTFLQNDPDDRGVIEGLKVVHLAPLGTAGR
jgi:hypothetical protein